MMKTSPDLQVYVAPDRALVRNAMLEVLVRWPFLWILVVFVSVLVIMGIQFTASLATQAVPQQSSPSYVRTVVGLSAGRCGDRTRHAFDHFVSAAMLAQVPMIPTKCIIESLPTLKSGWAFERRNWPRFLPARHNYTVIATLRQPLYLPRTNEGLPWGRVATVSLILQSRTG